MAIALQKAGYRTMAPLPGPTITDKTTPPEKLPIKLLSKDGKLPTRGSPTSARLDLYSSKSAIIPPNAIRLIDLDISLELPPQTYSQIQSRSSMAIKDIITLGGVIDSDYRGPVKVIIKNASTIPYTVTKGDRIAQLIIHQIQQPEPTATTTLSDTQQNKGKQRLTQESSRL